MIRYVILISLIFALLFYIILELIFGYTLKSYFTINYLIGYLLMIGNFTLMAKRLVRMERFKVFFYGSTIRLSVFCLLLFLWIKFGKLNIIGLMAGLIVFAITIPISALIYTRLGGNNGTPY